MSKDLPQQPQQSEEVDLGQLFKLIGNMFDKLFKFIGSVLYKIFLGFVWIVFFVKKHVIKLVIAGIVGGALGFLKEKTSEPVYKSFITVKQNYDTGESLYNSISYYNELVNNDDYEALENVLGIRATEVESVLGFDIESVISENERIKNYDTYLKSLDSVVASTMSYEMFLKNDEDYKHSVQQISIKSKTRDNFKTVFEKIIEGIKLNEHFIREQTKDLNELKARTESLKYALIQSDSLQKIYKKVLESSVKEKSASEIGITFEGTNNIDKTREFDLYKSNLEIREEIVDIAREIEDKEHIIEIVSSKQDSGSVDNKKEVLGLEIGNKLFYGLLLTVVTFLVLLVLNGMKWLERFKKEV